LKLAKDGITETGYFGGKMEVAKDNTIECNTREEFRAALQTLVDIATMQEEGTGGEMEMDEMAEAVRLAMSR